MGIEGKECVYSLRNPLPLQESSARISAIRAILPSLLPIIGESYAFCKRQQAVAHVTFWFLFLPSLATAHLADYGTTHREFLQLRPEMNIIFNIGYIALSLIVVWGSVCILSIGKRLLQAKSGRTRSSFKTVRMQAGPFFIPFLLTSILRSIFTVLWTLLLIVPGIMYFIRTLFFPVIVVCEGMAYRPALKRSQDIIRGRTGSVFVNILGISLLTFTPAMVLDLIFSFIAKDAPFAIQLAANVASSILTSFALVLYLLSLIQLFDYYRPPTGPVSN